MTDVEIAWLTGIFDGEGCISIFNLKRKVPSVQLIVSMTDKDIIDRIHAVTGVGSVKLVRQGKHWPGAQDQYRWVVGRKRDTVRLLLAMAPLLGERRRAKALEAANILAVTKGRG